MELDEAARRLEQMVGPRPRTTRYHAYINSTQWQINRAPALARAAGLCERCKERPPTEVHHVTYVRLGHEHPEDLQALCAECHAIADNERRARNAADVWWRRVDGWARARYGDNWADVYDCDAMEEELIDFLDEQGEEERC
jgi:5-methylcytosine-specific restriction endonuclease McrA